MKSGRSSGQGSRLMAEVVGKLRLRRYARRTELAYCQWIRRFIKFHEMKAREDLWPG